MSKYPLATKDIVDAKSKEIGVEIPKEYGDYLLVFNGGQPDKDRFVRQENGEKVIKFTVDYFLGIDVKKQDRFYDLYNQFVSLRGEMPKGFLPIGFDGVENLLALGVGKDNYGKVYRLAASDDPDYKRYNK